MASCRRQLITALLLVVGCLLGFCVGIREKKGIYEELKEGVKHIAEDVEVLKKDIVEDTNELKERMERTPVGKAEELREVAGIPKAHETAHEFGTIEEPRAPDTTRGLKDAAKKVVLGADEVRCATCKRIGETGEAVAGVAESIKDAAVHAAKRVIDPGKEAVVETIHTVKEGAREVKRDVAGAAESVRHWAAEKAHDVAEGAREAKETTFEKARKAKEGVKEGIREAGHYGANVAHKVKDKVKEKAGKIGEYARGKAKDVQNGIKELKEKLKGKTKEEIEEIHRDKDQFEWTDEEWDQVLQERDLVQMDLERKRSYEELRRTRDQERIHRGSYQSFKVHKEMAKDREGEEVSVTSEDYEVKGRYKGKSPLKEELRDKADRLIGDAEERTSEAAGFVADKARDAKEGLQEGIKSTADYLKEAVVEGATKARDYAQEKASEASEALRGAKVKLEEKARSEKDYAAETAEEARRKAWSAKDYVAETAEEAKHKLREDIPDTARRAFDRTKEKAAEAARGAYEGLKEGASKAKDYVAERADEFEEYLKRNAQYFEEGEEPTRDLTYNSQRDSNLLYLYDTTSSQAQEAFTLAKQKMAESGKDLTDADASDITYHLHIALQNAKESEAHARHRLSLLKRTSEESYEQLARASLGYKDAVKKASTHTPTPPQR